MHIIDKDADGSEAFAKSLESNLKILESKVEAQKELIMYNKNRPDDLLKIIKLLQIVNS